MVRAARRNEPAGPSRHRAFLRGAALERRIYVLVGDSQQALTTPVLLFLGSAAVFLGFLFIYDAVVFTHRIVGPLYRFRKVIQAITAGEELTLIKLRQGDLLLEM